MSEKKSIKKPFEIWTVKGVEYKLKLSTEAIIELESKLNSNLLNILNNGIPSLRIMAMLIHGALKKYNHGINLKDVNDILDNYFDEGGSQIDLFQNIIIPIFNVSGFFTPAMIESMEYKMKEADEQMNI
jgi:hypothetical protein|nr:MAG TPA: tail assembly chaperone [Caudoviricetes sp.]